MRNPTGGNRAFRYLSLLLLIVAIASGLVLYLSGSKSAGPRSAATINATPESFKGGPFEASGVVAVPGAPGVLFVDDGRTDEVLWMEMDGDGKQVGDIKPIKLGLQIEDPEGITTDGTYVYVVGSQSRGKSDAQAGLVRFKFNPATRAAEAVQAISGLKTFLVANVAELHDMGARKGKADGINIEGLGWDPARQRLLLGLRSPVVDGRALVVPLKLREAAGGFALDTGGGESAAIRLSLGGQGIRSLEYDERARVFQIIAGATEEQKKTDFKLWEWDGQANDAGLRDVATFDRKLKPEGITRAAIGDSNFRLVVFDTSQYLKLQ